jgi:hypothetical protein
LRTPKEILTKDDAWINRGDLLNHFDEICTAVPDDQLRAQINDYFLRRLAKEPTEEERRNAAAATAEQFPVVLDYYIKEKEDTGKEAHQVSSLKVRETEIQFGDNVRTLVDGKLIGTEFYELGNSFDESLRRVEFLQDVIENKDGWRIFYVDGKPLRREADLQIMYRLCWFATSYDVNREPNNGRGPVENELEKVQQILIDLKLSDRREIVLIDASSNNKQSASNVHDVGQ